MEYRFSKRFLCLALSFVLVISLALPGTAKAEEVDSNENAGGEQILQEQGAGDANNSVTLKENYEIKFTNDLTTYEYTGEEIKPEITVVKKGTEPEETLENEGESVYSVEYKNNLNVGTATVTVINKAKPDDKIEATFTIIQRVQIGELNEASVVLKNSTYIYDGKSKKPEVTVKDRDTLLVEGTDYSVKYPASSYKIGTYKVEITGIGAYTGTVEKEYKIQLGTVSSLKVTSSNYNKIVLKWNKVYGADGYKVYRCKKGSGEPKYWDTVEGGNTTTFTNGNVEFEATYVYKVRAYKKVDEKTVHGDYSNKVTRTAQMKATTITSVKYKSYNELQITWKKLTGAHGYSIYRSTSKNGTYKWVGRVTSGSKTVFVDDEKITCGRRYYYKVRAYRTKDGTRYGGEYSSWYSGYTRPTKGKFTYNEPYQTKVVLKWEKSSGATGYEIERRAAGSSKWTVVKRIKDRSTTSWTNTGLSKNKSYYYRIRAYKDIDGRRVYGKYSSSYKKSYKEGWRYVNGYKFYYKNGEKLKDVSEIIGKQSSYEIKVNKRMNTVTVYAKDGNNGYIIPVKAFVCSTGYATPIGTFKTPNKYRWHELMGPCWGQWCTRITGGILFHSVFYNSYNNNNALSVGAYNKLGITASHGCVRLTAGDAKWIYDNCKLGTKVTIYNSSTSGPLGKPKAKKLAYWHTWDPTDPYKQDKCDRYGCH